MRTALVTGGSGGIGKGCARKLCELGYDVVLVARREGPLRAAAEEIGARHIVADASDPDGFAAATITLETIDLVVHAAGTLGGTYARIRGSTAAVTTKHESRLAEMIVCHCSNVCLRA